MSIFIIEGMLMSSVGGIIGIILGVFGSQALTLILESFMSMGGGSFQLDSDYYDYVCGSCSWTYHLSSVFFSSLYPAWKAARMSPIEAVRYE